MVGYGVGYLVDSATGAGLVDQQSSFLGKLLLIVTVLGVLLIRKNSDVKSLRTMVKESTFYDKQWQATWKDDDDDQETPSSS
jgi:F0F1-type ATP synthase assembly protein I